MFDGRVPNYTLYYEQTVPLSGMFYYIIAEIGSETVEYIKINSSV